MYLSDYQKELVHRLSKEGPYGIFQDLEEFLVSHKVSFTWNNGTYIPKIPSEYRNYFIFGFMASNPQAYVEVRTRYQTQSIMNSQPQFTDRILKSEHELESEYLKLDKKEFQEQQELLYKFQGKLEAASHLIRILQENNLVISYEKDIEENFQFGEQLEENDDERIVKWKLFNLIGCLQNSVADSLDKFLRTQIIILPGLSDFEINKFCTIQEIDRQAELKHLRKQTKYVLFGILVSAFITIIPTLRECYIASESKSESESSVTDLSTQTGESGDYHNLSDSIFIKNQ